MTTGIFITIAAAVLLHGGAVQQTGPRPVAPSTQARAETDAAKPITLTGCVVVTPDREDMLQLVPAEPERGRPVGTSGVTPAWSVPSYLLLGGMVRFAEHANKLVEITGVPEPSVDAGSDPKTAGETPRTRRTSAATAAPARLQVQAAKVVAAACTPRHSGR